MVNFLYALIPVLAWGTWLAPSQNVPFPNQQVKTFYVTAANLGLAVLVLLIQGFGSLSVLTASSFWLVFVGGVIWALSGLCAFTATAKIGLARAFGIWAPLNIVVSMLWGAWLFDEFPDTSAAGRLTLVAAFVIVIAGVLMIIFAKGNARPDQPMPLTRHCEEGSDEAISLSVREFASSSKPSSQRHDPNDAWLGYAGAVGAGVLWGSYFIPIKVADISMWVGGFPLALGMLAGSVLLVVAARQTPRLNRPSDTGRTLLTGLIWGVGNYGMLLLVGALGAGRGFTIAQLSVVVNALVGIFWLKDPEPRSRAAWLTLAGCVLATVGGILLGNL